MAIQLHVDLQVDPAREAALIKTFHEIFAPVIRHQPGFQDVKLVRVIETKKGPAPAIPHRLIISFETEEQRQAWVATDDHQEVWPQMEQHLVGEKYNVVLYSVL